MRWGARSSVLYLFCLLLLLLALLLLFALLLFALLLLLFALLLLLLCLLFALLLFALLLFALLLFAMLLRWLGLAVSHMLGPHRIRLARPGWGLLLLVWRAVCRGRGILSLVSCPRGLLGSSQGCSGLRTAPRSCLDCGLRPT